MDAKYRSAKAQLLRRARRALPQTPDEQAMISFILANADAVLSRPDLFLEISSKLHKVARRQYPDA